MKQRILLLFLLLALTSAVSAQNTKRSWDQGPLTWDDFTLLPSNRTGQSLLEYELGFVPVHDTIDGIKSYYHLATAYMIPGASWVTSNSRTPELLRYHQVIFDMLEVERRNLQRSLNSTDDPEEFREMLYASSDRLNTRVAGFRNLTNDGSDTTNLASGEQQVRQELSLLPAVYRPSYTPHPFGFISYFSLGASLPYGTMGQAFSPGLTIGYGFEILCKRHFLNLEAYLGELDARKDLALFGPNSSLLPTNLFVEKHAYRFITINAGYGFMLVDSPRIQLAPVAGICLRSIGTLIKEAEHFYYHRFEPAVGLTFRRHFWRQNSFPQCSIFFGDKRMSERECVSLHSKVILSYSSFPLLEGSPTGFNLLAQVGIAFGGRYQIVH